jgi:hypothetical protein
MSTVIAKIQFHGFFGSDEGIVHGRAPRLLSSGRTWRTPANGSCPGSLLCMGAVVQGGLSSLLSDGAALRKIGIARWLMLLGVD